MKRDWSKANAKRTRCRLSHLGGCEGTVQLAHVIGCAVDIFELVPGSSRQRVTYNGNDPLVVHPVRVVPLCRKHHLLYDGHDLDLVGHLTPEEEAQAVLDAGGMYQALMRLWPSHFNNKRVA